MSRLILWLFEPWLFDPKFDKQMAAHDDRLDLERLGQDYAINFGSSASLRCLADEEKMNPRTSRDEGEKT